MMKAILLAIALGAGTAGSAMAQETMPACRDADYALPPPQDDPAAHRLFELPALVYFEGKKTPRDYGVNVDVVVDEAGRVTCATPGTMDGIDTPQRKVLFAQAAAWRYSPFTIDSKPARVWIREEVAEEVRPARHVAMPVAPLSSVTITLNSGGHTAVLRGDGTAKFDDGQAYSVGVGAFAALIERLRGADMWSLNPDYVVRLPDGGWPASIVVDIDGQKKAVAFLNPEKAGMPRTMQFAIEEVRRTARFDDWEVSTMPKRHIRPIIDHVPPPVVDDQVAPPKTSGR